MTVQFTDEDVYWVASVSKKVSLEKRAISFAVGKHFWLFLATVYGFARIPTWFFPFDSDHWIFYYVGRKWLDGSILYLEVWDHKSPLIFAINSAMHAVFGANIIWHRIFLTVVSVFSIWLFYKTAQLLLRHLKMPNAEASARVGTLVYAIWANLSQFTNSGNNTENFGVVALLLAYYMYLRWRAADHWKWLLYSGVGLSLVVFLKINFVILLLPLGIDFLIVLRKNIPRLIRLGFLWVSPVIAQALLWYSYFAPRGLLKEWWIAMVAFNGKYLRSGWAGNLSGQLIFLAVLSVAALFFAGLYYKICRDALQPKKRPQGLILTIAGFTLLFSVILGTFYSHYYLIVMPCLALLFAAYWPRLLTKPILALMAVSLIGSFAISYRQLYNSVAGPSAADFSNMEKAANAVHELTDDDDTIFFYGYGATFYQLAGRDSGSRFISASHLLIDEREGFGYNFTDKFIGDMLVSNAKYVVIDPATIDIYKQNEKAMQFIERRYQKVLTVAGYDIMRLKQ